MPAHGSAHPAGSGGPPAPHPPIVLSNLFWTPDVTKCGLHAGTYIETTRIPAVSILDFLDKEAARCDTTWSTRNSAGGGVAAFEAAAASGVVGAQQRSSLACAPQRPACGAGWARAGRGQGAARATASAAGAPPTSPLSCPLS